jgi:hypothetical protein
MKFSTACTEKKTKKNVEYLGRSMSTQVYVACLFSRTLRAFRPPRPCPSDESLVDRGHMPLDDRPELDSEHQTGDETDVTEQLRCGSARTTAASWFMMSHFALSPAHSTAADLGAVYARVYQNLVIDALHERKINALESPCITRIPRRHSSARSPR